MRGFAEVFTMFLFSLWKIYIGYSYFAFNTYSFEFASLIILFSVLCSYFITFYVFKKTKEKSWFIKFTLSKNYLKGAHFYKKYGFYPSILLAPVLLGIPTIALVSLTLKQNQKTTILGLMASSLLWGGIIYVSFYYSFKVF